MNNEINTEILKVLRELKSMYGKNNENGEIDEENNGDILRVEFTKNITAEAFLFHKETGEIIPALSIIFNPKIMRDYKGKKKITIWDPSFVHLLNLSNYFKDKKEEEEDDYAPE